MKIMFYQGNSTEIYQIIFLKINKMFIEGKNKGILQSSKLKQRPIRS